jgi:hypothetical protein
MPTEISCGISTRISITMRNTGTTTWSRLLEYRLGTNDDSDPFHPHDTRVLIPDDTTCVLPNHVITFSVPWVVPATAGTYTSDWRMLRESVEWFGDVAQQDVTVTCAEPGQDQINLAQVIVIKGAPGVASWPITSTLTSVTVAESELCTYHSMSGQWPTVPFFGDPENPIEGNQWLFANIGGQWYGGAGEWLRPGQQCKIVDARNIGPDEFYNDSDEPLHSWIPSSGELVGVMVSTPARAYPDMATLNQRSNVILVPWL